MAELTVFQVLDEIERKNYFLWDQLTEDEQKQFHPLVLMQWMGTSGSSPIRLQRVNFHLFNLSKSQQFLKLATAGQQQQRSWKWAAKKAKPANEEQLKAIAYLYDINTRCAQQALPLFSEQELAELLEEYRRDSSDTKETKKKR